MQPPALSLATTVQADLGFQVSDGFEDLAVTGEAADLKDPGSPICLSKRVLIGFKDWRGQCMPSSV